MVPLLADLRQSVREALRRPLFALGTTATLAIGVAAVTAVYSVVDAVLLRPLPYPDAGRLVAIWSASAAEGGAPGRVTGGAFSRWREGQKCFTSLGAFSAWEGTLTGRGEPRVLRGAAVTPDYFTTLGVAPIAGRLLAPDLGERAAVVSRRLAETLSGAPRAVGASLTLDGVPYVVVGVLPDGVYPTWPVTGPRMHFRSESQDVFVPLGARRLTERLSHVLGVVARLAPGVTYATAQREMDALAARLAADVPPDRREGVLVKPLLDEAVGRTREALVLVLGAAALVLVIACANVGALLLGRTAERTQEFALRRALGAGAAAFVRRFVADGLVVALAGGALGALGAHTALPALRRLVPQELPRLARASVDLRVLAAVLGVACGASLFFALVPLAALRRVDLTTALADARSGGVGPSRQRLRALLVGAEIALAVALAIGAGLLAETFRRLIRIEPGVAIEDVTVFDLGLGDPRFHDRGTLERFDDALLGRVRGLPGVTSAHLAYDHPLEINWTNSFSLPGRARPSETPLTSDLRFVTPGYFRGLRVPLLAGREFEERDRADRPGVAVIDEELARRFFGADDPVGQVVESPVGRFGWGDAVPGRFEIVGVVATVRSPAPGASVPPTLYLSLTQVPQTPVKLLVRSTEDPAAVSVEVRAALESVDAGVPIVRVRTLAEERRRAVGQPRFNLQLLGLFGTLALVLASIGVFGVVGAWVSSRTRELGVRVALGARPADVVRLVASRGSRLALSGIAGGWLLSAAGIRVLQSQLHGVPATLPAAWLAAPGAVLLSAALASLVPALRASRTPPAAALRAG